MIAFDIDGCVNTLKEDMIRIGRDFFAKDEVAVDETGYYLHEVFPGASAERYDAFWQQYGYEIYTNPPREDYYAVYEYVKKNQIEACYITTRVPSDSFGDVRYDEMTWNWLKKYEIELPVYFDKAKDKVAAELGVKLMVEDKPANIVKLREVTEVLIFDRSYNLGMPGKHVKNWAEVLEVLQNME